MNFLKKLLEGGRSNEQRQPSGYGQQGYGQPNYDQPRRIRESGRGAQPMTDQQAVDRYLYMLRTAPPETIEQAHTEAFSKLTPEQRRLVLEQLSSQVPPQERATSDDPQSLARMATRAEMRQPGTLQRTFGGMGGGMGMGGMAGIGMGIGGTILASLAAGFVGSMVAQSFMDSMGGFDDMGFEGGEGLGEEGGLGEEVGGEGFGEDMGGDFGGGDFGGDFGGFDV